MQILFHIADRLSVVVLGLFIVTHLHHKRSNVRKTHALLTVVLVEFVVDVIGI